MSIENALVNAFGGLGVVNAQGAVASGTVVVSPPGAAAVDTVTLGANTTFTQAQSAAAAGAGARKDVIITQDGTGSRTGTFTGVKFAGGTHTLSTAAGAVDRLALMSDGTTWYGTLSLAVS